MPSSEWGAIYKELGARPVINAIGSVTMLGGSTPPKEIRDAMEEADSAYVPLMELEEKAGALIARLIGVPAAYITSGAGSALTLATAAAMAGDDDEKIQQLPDTTGMKNEILIQARQRYWYDRCLNFAGAKLVEFGTAEGATRADLERAIGPKTAAVHYYAIEPREDPRLLPFTDLVQVAHAHGVPVTVDGAGLVYPLENMSKYVRLGADFQCIAAKYLGAPQSTGLALGTRDFVRKLGLQAFASYEGRRVRGVGRPQKVDRQEMIGCLVAVKRWMSMNHEERLAKAERQSQTILGCLRGVKGVKAEMINNIVGQQPFGVTVRFDKAVTGLTAQDVVNKLREGDPPIWTRVREGEDFIILHMFGLNEGEDKVVGERVAQIARGK